MSVRRCQEEIDSAEYNEWLAYSQIEMFGPPADDLRLGTLAAATYNVNRDSKKAPTPYGAADVFNWMKPPVEEKPSESSDVLLADPVAQTNLIRMSLFRKRAHG